MSAFAMSLARRSLTGNVARDSFWRSAQRLSRVSVSAFKGPDETTSKEPKRERAHEREREREPELGREPAHERERERARERGVHPPADIQAKQDGEFHAHVGGVKEVPPLAHVGRQFHIRRVNVILGDLQRAMDNMTSDVLPEMDDDFFGRRVLGGSLFPGLLLSAPGSALETDTTWAVNPVEVDESDEAYTITAEVPGFSKDHIKVNMTPDGVLSLSAELKEEAKMKEERARQGEEREPAVMRRHRRFSRTFRLPKDASTDGITAAAKEGILTVTVPKKAGGEMQVKEIPVA
ncbi:hypothetical protein FOA52_007552 [Chlamydomonas sp. UWO 241]|nr:hypothetical protein FOA52_007552 [Chlamydomonas sp. UWO 241]